MLCKSSSWCLLILQQLILIVNLIGHKINEETNAWVGLGRYLDYSLWEESNVGDALTWAGVLDWINRRKQAEHQPSYLSLSAS